MEKKLMEKKNRFGFYSLVLLGINSIIGTGIFVLPGKSYELLGPFSLVAVLVNVVVTLMFTLCFAKAGSYFTEDGAAYLYVRKAFGSFWGYTVGLTKYFLGSLSLAIFTVWIFSKGFVGLHEATGWGFLSIFKVELYRKIAGLLFITCLTLANLRGLKTSKWMNNLSTVVKLIPLLIFCAVGIFYVKAESFHPFVARKLAEVSDFKSQVYIFRDAALLIFFAFTGFEYLATSAGEMKDPLKELPKALIVVILVVALVYLLVFFCTIGILGDEMGNFALPLAGAGSRINGGLGIMIATGAVLSMLGISIASSYITPRSLTAMVYRGHLPEFLGRTNTAGIPATAIIITGILSGFLSWNSTWAYKMALISVIIRFTQYIPTALAVLVFRKKLGESHFKIFLGPLIPLLSAFIGCYILWTKLRENPVYLIAAFLVFFVTTFLYLLAKVSNDKGQEFS